MKNHESGKKPGRKDAMLAFCHECCGFYEDGYLDCENTRCPLYGWMPVRKLEPDLSWFLLNPRKRGFTYKNAPESRNQDSESTKTPPQVATIHRMNKRTKLGRETYPAELQERE